MGVATTPAPKGLGLQNPTKKLAHVGVLLGHLLSQNRAPKFSDPGPPLSAESTDHLCETETTITHTDSMTHDSTI